MAYTPELSDQASCTLRRIAWFLGIPMTKAIERVIDTAVKLLDAHDVCSRCKDPQRCDDCAFKGNPVNPAGHNSSGT